MSLMTEVDGGDCRDVVKGEEVRGGREGEQKKPKFKDLVTHVINSRDHDPSLGST